MLLVETELAPSRVHGIGTFLLEPVEAGQLIWRFDECIDRIITEAEHQAMPQRMRHYVANHSTFHKDRRLWVLCGDNGRYLNHATYPNTRSLGVAVGDYVAARPLPAGAELTADYRKICDAFRYGGGDFAVSPSADQTDLPPGSFDYQQS